MQNQLLTSWILFFILLHHEKRKMQGFGDIQKVFGGTLQQAISEVKRIAWYNLVYLPVLHHLLFGGLRMWD